MPLPLLILQIWALLAPGAERLPDAPRIADAIAGAVSAHPEPERWAAVMAVYAWRESNLRPKVTGDGGRSCGAFQAPCAIVRGLPLEAQARLWLSWVDASSLGAVDSSPARAARRERLAGSLLAHVQAEP